MKKLMTTGLILVPLVLGLGFSGASMAVSKHRPQKHAISQATSDSSKVNINTADEKTLQSITGIGAKKAASIVAYRKTQGKFKTIDDLTHVKGISVAMLEKLQAKNNHRLIVS